MADLALVTAGRLNPVSGVANGHVQYTFEAEEQINIGQAFRISTTTGKATKANATVVGESAQASAGVFNSQLYVAIDGARQAGNAVTGVKSGLLDGYNLDALAFGAPVYLSNTDGALGDAAGTVSTIVGRVQPAPYHGTPSGADKLLAVNMPPVA
jgi:hypothetical protein